LNLALQEARAFIEFDHQTVKREDGIILIKTRELIALAITQTTQCAYCIDIHTKGAMRAGASKQ
jgi:AhpD family alkylhydroperoxidase